MNLNSNPVSELNNSLIRGVMKALIEQGVDGFMPVFQLLMNEAMKVERSEHLHALPYERSEERQGQANGFKPKTVLTRSRPLDLSVPQVRDSSFYPQALERGSRSEVALKLALAEMYVTGVSTRKVSLITEKLCGTTTNEDLVRLVTVTLEYDPRVGVTLGSSLKRRSMIPFEKSFHSRAPNEGLPIGNLTSQFGANVYLNSLDHFVSRSLRPAGYLRYMDDLTLVDRDPEKLRAMEPLIRNWLRANREQELHPAKTSLTSLSRNPIELLGYKISAFSGELDFRIRPIKQWEFVAMLRHYERYGTGIPKFDHPLSILPSDKNLKKLIASVNARTGLMKYAKTYRFRRESLTRLHARMNERRAFLGEKKLTLSKDYRCLTAPKYPKMNKRDDRQQPKKTGEGKTWSHPPPTIDSVHATQTPRTLTAPRT